MTVKQIDALKPKERSYRVADGGGLYLVVNPTGSKKWYFRYRFDGKQKSMALGGYPDISLARARELLLEARSKVANGMDPLQERKERKREREEEKQKKHHTFEKVAADYVDSIEGTVSLRHWQRTRSTLRMYINPAIGQKPIEEITAREIERVIASINIDEGKPQTARKAFGVVRNVFRYARSRLIIENNVTTGVKIGDIVPKPTESHRARLTTKADVKRLLTAFDTFDGYPVTKLALKFGLLTSLRSAALRHLTWEMFDNGRNVLVIPRSTPGMKREIGSEDRDENFTLPLSIQALTLLDEAEAYRTRDPYIFPGARAGRPLSENTLLIALRTMGFEKGELTFHGFRGMLSTFANNLSPFNPMLIESQLDHRIGGDVMRAYNGAGYTEKRRELVQWWADWLDEVGS